MTKNSFIGEYRVKLVKRKADNDLRFLLDDIEGNWMNFKNENIIKIGEITG